MASDDPWNVLFSDRAPVNRMEDINTACWSESSDDATNIFQRPPTIDEPHDPGTSLIRRPLLFLVIGFVWSHGLMQENWSFSNGETNAGELVPNMVLEPGGGLSFPLPPGSGSSASGGSLLAPTRLFQRTTPVFPFHLTGWPPHHPVLGQVQSQVQQSMQAQHQAAAAAVRFLSHHHPHHPHPALSNHSLVPAITGHHPTAHHLHHTADHGEEDDEKKGE